MTRVDISKIASFSEEKSFPYYPEKVPAGELMRQHLLTDLNFWAVNDEEIAKEKAITLINLLKKQFGIEQ